MKIESYSFGRMVVDGETYNKDLVISGDAVISPWWRKEGHNLCCEDLEGKVEGGTEILVIGTGSNGVMKISQPVKEKMERSGISLHIERTDVAVKIFNHLSGQGKKVNGAFHLTC